MYYLQKKLVLYIGGLYLCAALSGCLSTAENSSVSNTDVPALQNKTAHVQKDILLIFTGSDWAPDSPLFSQNVLTAEVKTAIGNDFTVHYIDLPRETGQRDAQELRKNYLLFSEYHVTDVPFIVMQTAEQDTYAAQPLSKDVSGGTAFLNAVELLRKNREAVVAGRSKIAAASGYEKAIAIDSFLNTVHYPESHKYDSLRMSVPDLDPENRSGLKGKYLLIAADMQAKRFTQKENFIAAGDSYKAAAESGILTPEELQLAWYFTAYSYMMSGKIPHEHIIGYLNAAIKANPDSPAVEQLKEIREKL